MTITIHVLLSGRLKLDGYGEGYPLDHDGTYQLEIPMGGKISDVIRALHIPADQVKLTMLNSRKCISGASLSADDRVILIPADVAAMWQFLGNMNLGMASPLDF